MAFILALDLDQMFSLDMKKCFNTIPGQKVGILLPKTMFYMDYKKAKFGHWMAFILALDLDQEFGLYLY